ncbi:MAG: hypothetical protein UW66_C0065G0009, partial [Candidatus Moranbacteria bacterium GW2011_GWF1_44_4]
PSFRGWQQTHRLVFVRVFSGPEQIPAQKKRREKNQ